MTDETDRDDSTTHARPRTYEPRGDSWATKAVPMPAWAKTFAKTGRLPPAEERRSNAPGGTPDDVEERRANAQYARAWRGIERDVCRLKSEAAKVGLGQNSDHPLARAASKRLFELDEEFERLARLRDKGAPLSLRSFPPLDGAAAGRALDAVEREAVRNPLFDPRRRAAGDVEDIVDSFPGGSL